ncbi:MAG: hypothetical protein AAFO68_06690 [Pseudomonadota bacterium]
MAEAIDNELLFRLLQSIQARLDRMDARLGDMTEELVGIRTHQHATQGETNQIYTRVSSVEQRLQRIEKRLDIIGEPAE